MRYQYPEYVEAVRHPDYIVGTKVKSKRLLGKETQKALRRAPKSFGIWSRRSDLNR